ncbi:hypothetical protein [Pseudomonas sp. NA-150]|uniref:hypothetical protein n=1 Tax=Pseudomonas sp. NA-150 TaxID=3367525 RepID=UPI0037CB8187
MYIAGSRSPDVQLVEPLHMSNGTGNSVSEPATKQVSAYRPGESVSISGRTLLMTRVFFSKNLNFEPEVIKEFNFKTQTGSCAFFLNKEDRQVLADMYEFAQEEGADLSYVDNLAFSLGRYRQSDNEKYKQPQSVGGIYDIEGRKIFYDFTDKDAATAKRILASESLKTSRLDQAFIRQKTNVQYGGLNHPNFEFMEAMIDKFSARGDKVSSLNGRFSQYKWERDVVERLSQERYLDPKKKSGSTSNKNKGKAVNAQSTQPETLKQALRRIVTDYLRFSMGRVSSLADFLMRSGR